MLAKPHLLRCAALCLSLAIGLGTAAAQALSYFSYENEQFYIRATSRNDIRIGVKDPNLRLATNKRGKLRQEVLFYDASRSPEGYSVGMEDICDPDFFINDNQTEMKSQARGDGAKIYRALHGLKGGVKIGVQIEDADGKRTVFFTLPDSERRKLVDALKPFSGL